MPFYFYFEKHQIILCPASGIASSVFLLLMLHALKNLKKLLMMSDIHILIIYTE
jgi:hypothetical protein